VPYRLFPIVSPNKTWIGAVGSITTALGMVFLGDYLMEMNIPWYHILAISIIGNGLAQIGDLFESFIKRVYKVKDSGSIIPGHGGVLDRFDGFFFATPFLYWYLEKIYFV
jgi:phosphatidate cytidylyltransferase